MKFLAKKTYWGTAMALLMAGPNPFVGNLAHAETPATIYSPDIVALTQNDARLGNAILLHRRTPLGLQDISALATINTRVCFAAPDQFDYAFSGFTQREICNTANVVAYPYYLVINRVRTNSEIERAAQALVPLGTAPRDAERMRDDYVQSLWPILASLYLSNESTTALQVKAGIILRQARLADTRRWRDYAAVDLATEISSDARMLKQASDLIHTAGQPKNLVTAALNIIFPDGVGGELLQTYEAGFGQPGYNATANMTRAMTRLWDPNSSDRAIRQRTAVYWEKAFAPGEPTTLPSASTPLGQEARALIHDTARTSGDAAFAPSLLRIASTVAATPRHALGLPVRPRISGRLPGINDYSR